MGYVLRWNSLYMTVKQLLNKEMIGRIFHREVDYMLHLDQQLRCYNWCSRKEKGGSILMQSGCHAVDGMCYFAGKPVREVAAFSPKNRPDFDHPTTYSTSCPEEILRKKRIHMEKIRKRMEFTRFMDGRYMDTCAGPAGREKAFIRNMEEIAEYTEEIDLSFLLETHGDIIGPGKAAAQVMKQIPSRKVQLCYDPANVYFYSSGGFLP